MLERAADARWFRAPGRVNLIGDHTDYNDGFVLPLAIDRWCVVAAREASAVRVRSLDVGETVDVAADGSTEPEAVAPGFGRYVAAVVRELAALGRPPVGLDAVLASDVPLGSGLSSSAALEVACAVALAGVAEWEPDPIELARACRAAEELATGVAGGIMDQLVSISGRADRALLIDCRSLELRARAAPDPTSPSWSCTRASPGRSRGARTPSDGSRARSSRESSGTRRCGRRRWRRWPTIRSAGTS